MWVEYYAAIPDFGIIIGPFPGGEAEADRWVVEFNEESVLACAGLRAYVLTRDEVTAARPHPRQLVWELHMAWDPLPRRPRPMKA